MSSCSGYYDVTVETNAGLCVHRVYAVSDYAAAVRVREETGFMPKSELDVAFVRAEARKSLAFSRPE